jgi:prevent-host-death family protein
MATSAHTYDIETKLSELVEHARGGEDVIVVEKGKPVAKVVAMDEVQALPQVRRMGENVLGITYIAPDFDEPAWSEEELESFGF